MDKKRVTDANKTPLGRPPPNFPKPASNSSLLKPSYLSSDSYDSKPSYEQYQPQQPVTQAPYYSPPQPPQFTHYEYEAYAQQLQPATSSSSAVLSFSTQFETANNNSVVQNKIVPANFSKWDSHSPYSGNTIKRDNDDSNDSGGEGRSRERKRKRRTRWMGTENEKAVIPGMPTILPSDIPTQQAEAYISQLQIEELTRKLRTGDLGIPPNPEDRSPSPEPIYGTDGKRLNTRDYRTRKKLEDERHRLIQKLLKMNPDYKAPADYRAPVVKIVDRVSIPQEEHPEINFVGLLIGPRGNTLKGLEKDTGAKIIIRGKGSVKEGKVGGKAGLPLPGEDEPLHAYVTSNNPESVKKACDKIKDIIRQGIDMPESQNDLRKNQLRELALLNGTLREGEGPKCSNCGATSHRTWNCPDKPNVTNSVICTVCGGAGHIGKDCRMKRPGQGGPPTINPNERAKIDEEYMSLMAELGEGNTGKEGYNSGVARNSFQLSSTPNLFQRSQAPKPIAAPLPSAPGVTPQQAPPSQQSNWSSHGYQQHHSQHPPPPGVQPPLPPTPSTQNYMTQSWNSGSSQPPPPGMYWTPADMYWQPPPPPPLDSKKPPPPPPN